MKRRYALLNNASETEGRWNLRRAGVQRRGTAPLGAVIPKRPVPEASWVRRKAIFNGRKSRRTFSDLFLSCIKEITCMLFASVSGLAQ